MTVILYSTSDDNRVLNKSLTAIATITASPLENCTLLNPRMRFRYNASLKSANYMYIPDFNRYYYIRSMSVNTGGEYEAVGDVDVLKTYASDIRNAQATIIRSESIGGPTYIPDSKLPVNPNKKELRTAKQDFNTSSDNNIYLVRLKSSKIKYHNPD